MNIFLIILSIWLFFGLISSVIILIYNIKEYKQITVGSALWSCLAFVLGVISIIVVINFLIDEYDDLLDYPLYKVKLNNHGEIKKK